MENSLFTSNRPTFEKLLSAATSIGVVVDQSHTLDMMAAGLSLFLSLQSAGKNVQIISKKEPTVEISNLVGINKVKSQFEGKAKTLTIALPYKEGEIEKVSYNIEGEKLNINLFAMPDASISFAESDVQYIRKGSAPDLIIAVGVPRLEFLQNIVQINEDTKIVTIGTKQFNNPYGDIMYVNSNFSSFSEIVCEMLKSVSLPMDVDVAQNLLDGISFATKNFSIPQTSVFAFDAAAVLMSQGARRKVERQPREVAFSPEPKEPKNVQPVPVQPKEEEKEEEVTITEKKEQKKIPHDWFVPKVYKGSKDQ